MTPSNQPPTKFLPPLLFGDPTTSPLTIFHVVPVLLKPSLPVPSLGLEVRHDPSLRKVHVQCRSVACQSSLENHLATGWLSFFGIYMVVKDMGRFSWEFLYNFHWEFANLEAAQWLLLLFNPPQNDRHLYHAVGWVEPHILWR